MENKINKISFEDTDKDLDIEIYGEKFKLNENKLINVNTDEIKEDEDQLERLLEDILGEGSIEKLNKIRKENGYEKMEASQELAVLEAVIRVYTDAILKPIDSMANTYDRVQNAGNRYNRRNNQFRNGYNNNKYRRY